MSEQKTASAPTSTPKTTETNYRFKTEARVDDTVRFTKFMDKYLGADLK